ncbi:hypothetical protein M9H77_11701 [Catharanthus roseus]|uniref:Uncharacterized protein n=1 Tax=Catharanthus roseus TaxID=4058 RepID=A0ACC0BFG7_CATRO|nr:hypothetical protein M9H77_11701 [Catharanthus roseus]
MCSDYFYALQVSLDQSGTNKEAESHPTKDLPAGPTKAYHRRCPPEEKTIKGNEKGVVGNEKVDLLRKPGPTADSRSSPTVRSRVLSNRCLVIHRPTSDGSFQNTEGASIPIACKGVRRVDSSRGQSVNSSASTPNDKKHGGYQNGFEPRASYGILTGHIDKSSKQDTVVDSTTEAEYMTAYDAAKEAVWTEKLITFPLTGFDS